MMTNRTKMMDEMLSIAQVHKDASLRKELEEKADDFIALVLLTRLTLRHLDSIENSGYYKQKLKQAAKGFMKELEFMDDDIREIGRAFDPLFLNEVMEGQRLCLNWIASLKLKELMAISRASGIKIDWASSEFETDSEPEKNEADIAA